MGRAHYREEFYRVSVLRHKRTGQLLSEHWYYDPSRSGGTSLDERTHRIGAPAVVFRDRKTGNITSEAWFQNGDLHREDGPASIRRDPKSGVVIREAWWRNGELHRLDGPAIVCRNAVSGKVTYTQWYREDQLIPYRDRPKLLNPHAEPSP